MSCYASKLICYNTVTGESFPLSCRSYTCETHGAYNRHRLRTALLEYLKRWKQIRFWTFTLSNLEFDSVEEHLKTLNKVWRYFVTYLRRNGIFRPSEKLTQYIRFVEPHASGFAHFHAVFDRYVPWHKIDTIWRAAIETVTWLDGSRGGCHVKGINSARNTAYYIVKYVTKAARAYSGKFRRYSKSSRVALFPKKKSRGIFAIHNTVTNEWYGLSEMPPLLVESSTQLHKFHPQFELFAGFRRPRWFET